MRAPRTAAIALSASLLAAGCGDSRERGGIEHLVLTPAERDVEVRKTAIDYEIAVAHLDLRQQHYLGEIALLPEECRDAIESFLPPLGDNRSVSDDFASSYVGPFCMGRPNAIPHLRGLYKQLVVLQEEVDMASLSLMMNLGDAGVTPAPTTP